MFSLVQEYFLVPSLILEIFCQYILCLIVCSSVSAGCTSFRQVEQGTTPCCNFPLFSRTSSGPTLHRRNLVSRIPFFVSTRCTDFVESVRRHILVTWSASRVAPLSFAGRSCAKNLYRCKVFALGSWKSQIAVRGEKSLSSWCGTYYTFLHLTFEVLLVSLAEVLLSKMIDCFLLCQSRSAFQCCLLSEKTCGINRFWLLYLSSLCQDISDLLIQIIYLTNEFAAVCQIVCATLRKHRDLLQPSAAESLRRGHRNPSRDKPFTLFVSGNQGSPIW